MVILKTDFLRFLLPILLFFGGNWLLYAQDSTQTNAGRRLTAPLDFKADSLHITFEPPKISSGRLAGKAIVSYQNTKVEHEQIDLFFEQNQVRTIALFRNNQTIKPKFSRDKETFTAQSLLFNFETGRGRIEQGRTQLEDGFLHAAYLKNMADSVIFAQDALYTTCDEDHPHYHFRASKMKIVNKRWIFSGPIHLRVLNIPLPAWLPFGALPTIEGRRSGPLRAQYGEDTRGFYLRNVGYYWAASPYFDAQLTGGLWTGGSWQLSPTIRYAKRYKFDGNLSFDWTRNRSGERYDPDYQVSDQKSFRWVHNQQFNPSSRLNASVDLRTSAFNQTAINYNDQVSQTTSSSVRFSKSWSKSSFSASLLQTENFSTRAASFTLPSLSYSRQTHFPFQKSNGSNRQKWYETISYSYNFDFSNQYNFTPLSTDITDHGWFTGLKDDALFESITGRNRLERFEYSAKYSLPINANFVFNKTPFKKKPMRLNLNPNVQYTQHWYGKEDVKSYDTVTQQVKNNPIQKFVDVHEFSAGVNASTDIYGIFDIKVGNYQRFRHTMTPNLGFTYAPSYAHFYRYYKQTATDSVRYSIVPAYLPFEKQNALTFSVSNLFQGKKVQTDSTGAEKKEIVNLLNLDLSSSYNFAAKTQHWSDLTINARSRLFEKVDFSANARYSPYLQSSSGGNLDSLRWDSVANPSIFRDLLAMKSASVTLGTSFQSKSASGTSRPVGGDIFSPNSTDNFSNLPVNTPVGYSNFDIPWRLQVGLTYNYTAHLTEQHHLILNNSFDFNLTPKWKIAGRTGFDFKTKQVSNTSFSVTRDLHCWEMQFNIIPFGTYQSFGFSLYVKSGKLKDILKISQPKQDIQVRF